MVRIRLSALLALIACVSVSPAQSQEDSVALLTGPRAVSELGAAVTVIDVDSLRREFPVRALSELLTGRVPGLVVLASSGTIGTASRLLIRGASSFRGSEAPQVYVDGIRVDDEPSTLTVSVGGQTTSRVDDINVEDIATIAILRGPAAAALYGRDATAGVLLVTTKREQGGRPRLTAFTSQGLVTRAGRFPDNFLAVDSTGRQCDAGQLVTSTCRLLRANVLESPATSPFRDGYLRQYGLRVSGGGATTRYYLSGQWDGLAGAYALPGGERARLLAAGGLRPETESPNYFGRVNLRGNGQLLAGPKGDVTLTLGYFVGDLRLPLNDTSYAGVLRSGLLGSADTTAGHGWAAFPPGDMFQVLSVQRVRQVTASAAANWRPLKSLTLHAVVGLDRANQHDAQQQRPGEGPIGSAQLSRLAEGRLQSNRYTVAVTAAATFPLSATLIARAIGGVEYFKQGGNLFDSTAVTSPVSSFGGSFRWPIHATTAGLFLEQQLAWRDRLFLSGSLRRDATTWADQSAPKGLAPHVGIAWHVPTAQSALLGSLRLRAAYGATDRLPGVPFVPPAAGSLYRPVAFGPRPDRVHELEGGADAELVRGRMNLSATVYSRHSWSPLFFGGNPGVPLIDDTVEVANKGIELALGASVVRSDAVAWEVGLSAWGNRNRVVSAGPFPLVLNGGGSVFQTVEGGLPLGSYSGMPILGYADANHDGVLSPAEVQLGTARAFLGTPLPTEGAALTTALTWRRRVRIASLLEYRAGSSVLNDTELMRCARGNCRARNDPTTPLRDQLAWAAWQAGSAAGWIERANFLKLRAVSLTVTAPAAWAQHVGGGEMTFTLAGRNLVTWTSYRGLDPEVNAAGSQELSASDFFTQPLARYWTARLDLSF